MCIVEVLKLILCTVYYVHSRNFKQLQIDISAVVDLEGFQWFPLKSCRSIIVLCLSTWIMSWDSLDSMESVILHLVPPKIGPPPQTVYGTTVIWQEQTGSTLNILVPLFVNFTKWAMLMCIQGWQSHTPWMLWHPQTGGGEGWRWWIVASDYDPCILRHYRLI